MLTHLITRNNNRQITMELDEDIHAAQNLYDPRGISFISSIRISSMHHCYYIFCQIPNLHVLINTATSNEGLIFVCFILNAAWGPYTQQL